MKTHKIKLLTSGVKASQYPDLSLPEIALSGRSNVGKSSFVNAMVNQNGVARTSSQPGKTQTLNFYNINDTFRFVDVPGYGYARVSKNQRDQWNKTIRNYLSQRDNLMGIFLLMDFRHEPTNLDIEMKDYVEDLDIPYAVIATKVDKVKKSQYSKHMDAFVKKLQLPSEEALFLFSATSKLGREEVWQVVESLIE